MQTREYTKGVERMKSIVLRLMLVLTALAVVPDALAADTSSGNVFLDARFGETFISASGYGHSRTARGADGGYLWNLDEARALGFEVGYAQFGTVEEEAGNSGTDHITASAISAGVHYQYLFGEDKATFFQARGGLISTKFDDDFTVNFGPGSGAGTDSWRQAGIYLGLGVGRKITHGFSIILDFSNYNVNDSGTHRGRGLNLNWLALIAEYRF